MPPSKRDIETWLDQGCKKVTLCWRCGNMENLGPTIEAGELFTIDFASRYVCLLCRALPKTDRHGKDWMP